LWRDFPAKIAKYTGYNVLIYDRIGYGDSDPFVTSYRSLDYLTEEARNLPELLDALSISNTILFGHSDGGSIALIFGSLFPQRTPAIITVGAHVFVEPVTLKGIREAVDAYKSTDLHERLEKYHNNKAKDVFLAWADTWLRPDFIEWNIEHYCDSVKCPALIIQGIHDEFGTEAQVNSIIKRIGNKAQKIILPEAAHNPHKEAPEMTLRIVTQFLQSIE
jgi:pimeloyl-ACP methyl ester carboxylesterase